MKNWPCAKLTIVKRPKISEMPSATRTKIEPRARPVKSCRRNRSRVMGLSPLPLDEGGRVGEADRVRVAAPAFSQSRLRRDSASPFGGEALRLVPELAARAEHLLVGGVRVHDVEDVPLAAHL